MADIKELDEAAKRQIAELNSTKIDLISALDRLVINEEKNFNLPSHIGNNIPLSFRDNFNSYIYLIKDLLEKNKVDGVTTNYLKGLKLNIDDLFKLKDSALAEKNLDEFNLKTRNTLNLMDIIYEEFKKYLNLKNEFNQLSFNAISETLAEVKKQLSDFKRLRGIADTALTENIYNTATNKYSKQANIYKGLFIGSLLLIAYIVNVFDYPTNFNLSFWMPKITLSLIGITLVTYFLKQSSHYQKLADQSYQTQVELQALPSFIANISSIESAELIRKELALKYFGKDVDGAPHKDMSNLINDQMKSTTELVKATTNIVKKQ